MYLSVIKLSNFRCFNELCAEIKFQPGLNALVGENDSGKTAIIDAIRFVLGTRDQEWIRIEDSDFHSEDTSKKIQITCKFEGLSSPEKGAFLEYLTYETDNENKTNEVLYINWTAIKDNAGKKSTKTFIKTEMRSGKNADGPTFAQEAKELLRVTYLKPLRDAENAMSAGKNSRLSQILKNMDSIKEGKPYEEGNTTDFKSLSIAGIASLADNLLNTHEGIKQAKHKIDKSLADKLLFTQEKHKAKIQVAHSDKDEQRLKIMLEKLNLNIERQENNAGHLGLGTNNLLYMACELLLLQQEKEGNRMLLIEEPEAHIHAQRQLKIMKSLQNEAKDNNVQIIITTHSPLLASVINLENMILVQSGKVFSLEKSRTELASSDYLFLERFLDATKANLFFAKGVMIVEGDAENILLPAIARLLGRDFADYGVSIVNVGGTGLRRYARIFHRKDKAENINVPVACITDLDIRPDNALKICYGFEDKTKWPELSKRKWRAFSEFTAEQLSEKKENIRTKCDGQNVKTFISGEWTFEYDLAYSGLAKEVYMAAKLAINDETDIPAGKSCKDVWQKAHSEFKTLLTSSPTIDIIAAEVYALFTRGTKASKAIAAQYLAHILDKNYENKKEDLYKVLPSYIKEAIEHVTGGKITFPDAAVNQTGENANV